MSNAALNIPTEDVRALELLRTRLTPLVYNLQKLMAEMLLQQDVPVSWPIVHRHIALFNSHQKALHELLNSEHHKKADQSVVTVSDVLSNLNVYPISPFPVDRTAPVVATLIRKKPDIVDETFIAKRLESAARFCEIPEDWKIEPPRDEDEASATMENEEYGGVKRVKTALSEEEISEIWSRGGWSVAQLATAFNYAVKGGEEEEDEDDIGQDMLDLIEETRKELGVEPDETPATTPRNQVQQTQAEKQAPVERRTRELGITLGLLDGQPSTG